MSWLKRQNEVKAADHSVFSPSAGAQSGRCTGNGHGTEGSRGGPWDKEISTDSDNVQQNKQ